MEDIGHSKFEVILNTNNYFLVDFYSTVCAPCKAMKKALENKDFSSISIYSINVDNYPDDAVRFGIRSVPTLLVFKNGKVQDQFVGKPTVSEIKRFLKI